MSKWHKHAGVVHFQPTKATATRRSTETKKYWSDIDIGHYTGIYLRKDGKSIEFDDNKYKENQEVVIFYGVQSSLFIQCP